MNRVAIVCLSFTFVGSITLTYPAGTHTMSSDLVEVRFGPLVEGSSAGANFSEASAAIAGSLVSLNTSVLYLNNTNATGVWYARLATVSISGVGSIVSLTVGISNGTDSVPQVVGALGALSQTEGPYVRLEPGSTNQIYVTQAVTSLLAPETRLTLDVYAADTPSGSAYVITNANLTLT